MKKVCRIVSIILVTVMITSSLSVIAAPYKDVFQDRNSSVYPASTSAKPTPTMPTPTMPTPTVPTPTKPAPIEPDSTEPIPEKPDNNDTDENVDKTIKITNIKDIQKIGNDDDYPLDGHYRMLNDIEMPKLNGFKPIGTASKPFTGIFDGNGHVIYNLTIEESGDNVGLFGVVREGGVVKNVGVENGSVVTKGRNVGGIVGWAAEATVENCYFIGDIVGGLYVGGVVGCIGKNGDYISTSTINSCYQIGNITGGDMVGGIVGNVYSSLYLKSCYHIGELKQNVSKGVYYGGIVGYINLLDILIVKMENSYYNTDLCGDIVKSATGYSNYSNFKTLKIKGLETDQMIGPTAINNMVGFEESYIAAPIQIDEKGNIYSPQLSVFIKNKEDLSEYPNLKLNKKKVHLKDGEIFDIKNFDRMDGVEIWVDGAATIIGKKNVQHKTNIIVNTDEKLVLRNLNIIADDENESAITITSGKNANLQLEGENKFSGYMYKNYAFEDRYLLPDKWKTEYTGKTSGMYIAKDASVTVTQGSRQNKNINSSFLGCGTGAGIYTFGDLYIKSAGKITAKNSPRKLYNQLVQQSADISNVPRRDFFLEEPVTGFAAGIGVGDISTFSQYCHTVDVCGKINIDDTEIIAAGGKMHRINYNYVHNKYTYFCWDIGGVGVKYDKLIEPAQTSLGVELSISGTITNSCITAENALVDPKIEQKNNKYAKDQYIICLTIANDINNSFTNEFSSSIGLTGNQGTVDMIDIDFSNIGATSIYAPITNSLTKLVSNKTLVGTVIYDKGSPGVDINEIQIKGNEKNKNFYISKISAISIVSGEKFEWAIGKQLTDTPVTINKNDDVYKISFKTSDDSFAGTDSNIKYQLTDDNGHETEPKYIGDLSVSNSSFKKGKTDVVYVDFDCTSENMNIKIQSDLSGTTPEWLLEKITVEHQTVTGKNISSFSISPNMWIADTGWHYFSKCAGNGIFKVTIHTKNEFKAGTDSNIMIRFGNGDSETIWTEWIDFDNYSINPSKDHFERNDTDTAIFKSDKKEISEISDVKKIQIQHDGKGIASGWLPDKIMITELTADKKNSTTKLKSVKNSKWIDDEIVEYSSKNI